MKNVPKFKPPRTCDGLVCYAGIDWWYHSQGHNDQQIMKRLVRHIPVLWVNSIGMRFPIPGQTDLILSRYWRKIRSTLKGLRKDSSGIWIYSPFFIPIYTPGVLEINGFLLNLQVRLFCRILGIHNPCAWITVPTATPALERGRWQKIFFNRCDRFSSNPETNQTSIYQLEQRLLAISDHVIYSSRELMIREQIHTGNGIYLGHGVDVEHFSRPRDRREIPEMLYDLPHPIVGFYGSLDTYTIDLPLLIKIARKISPGTLLIIGLKAMDISELLREKNVVYLKQVPYDKIPHYAQAFDVGIMPWQKNRWILTSNPIKLKEYLAVGFPVVSIDFPELEPYKNLVYAAGTSEEFLKILDNALKEKDPAMRQKRREAILGSNWDKLAQQVLHLIFTM